MKSISGDGHIQLWEKEMIVTEANSKLAQGPGAYRNGQIMFLPTWNRSAPQQTGITMVSMSRAAIRGHVLPNPDPTDPAFSATTLALYILPEILYLTCLLFLPFGRRRRSGWSRRRSWWRRVWILETKMNVFCFPGYNVIVVPIVTKEHRIKLGEWECKKRQ